MSDPLTAAVLTVAAKEAIKTIVKPLLEGALKGMTSVTDIALETFTSQFLAYIERQVEKHSYINTLVFQNRTPLEDLYIPLTVVQQTADFEEDDDGILINHFAEEFIPKQKRVLITDTAGMGKSTLLRYLLINAIKSNFAIPVFIELRHMSQARPLLTVLETELNLGAPDGTPKFTKEKIVKILKEGKLIFFLDGYDEIPFKERESVTKDIKDFVDYFPKNHFALTSRPESGLAAFPSFAHFKIRRLTKPESFALIKQYDKDGGRSKQLIQQLQGPELRAVHEFLENPLLTTLLYRCFEYKQNIPEKKHVFYRQVFDALYDWHDASKDGYNTREKRSKLDLDDFHRVLRAVGFISVMKGEVEGDKDQVLGWIRDAKRVCVGLDFSESEFLLDASTAVPVLVKDGLFYKWSHKSLSEYFATQYICTEGKEQQEQVFNHLKTSGDLRAFYNILDQLYDVDQPAFRKYFTLPLARAFADFSANSYKNIPPAIPIEEIELRRNATFSHPVFLTRGKNFPEGIELRNELRKLKYASCDKVESLFDLEFVTFSPVRLSTPKLPIVVARLDSEHSVVADILSAKADPIAMSRSRIDAYNRLKPLKKLGSRQIYAVTDDPQDVLNSIENFAAVNRVLLARGWRIGVIDGAQCQQFLNSYADEQTKVDFTRNLLIITQQKT